MTKKPLALCTKIVDTVNPDLIDINFGCPVKKVAMTKGAGAGVLKDLDLMVRLTESVVKSTNSTCDCKNQIGMGREH